MPDNNSDNNSFEVEVNSGPDEATDEATDQPLVLDGVEFPREASQRIRDYSDEEYSDWLTGRYRARTDPIWLGNTLMGLNLSEDPHRVFSYFLEKSHAPDVRKLLMLAPRGTAKTHFMRADQAMYLLGNPNGRVVLLSGGENVAVPMLEALKRAFSHPCEEMMRLFPEYVLKSKLNKSSKQWEDVLVTDWGNQHSFTVPCRTDLSLPEASLTLATQESISSGIHADRIYVDDLQNNANSKTEPALKKTFQSYLDVLPLLMPSGTLIVSGTRYAVGDAYDQIMQRAEGERSQWRFLVEDCFCTSCLTCHNPESFHDKSINILEPPGLIHATRWNSGYECPGFKSDDIVRPFCPVIACRNGTYGHTMEFLAESKREDAAFFACQYLNAPELIEAKDNPFTEAVIAGSTIFTQEQLALKCPPTAPKFVMVDLAYSTGLRSDSTVILIFSKWLGQLFIWGCVAGKWDASQRIVNLLAGLRNIRPTRMWIENNIGADSTVLLLKAAATAEELMVCPVELLDADNHKDAKAIRIQECHHLMTAHRLWLASWMPSYDMLRAQLLRTKEAQGHDDMADCMALCAKAPTFFLSETPPATLLLQQPNWLRDLNQAKEVDDSYPDTGMGNGLVG